MDKTILTAVIVAAASFVMQKTLNNIIYGIVIFFTRPFKKGDKIFIRQIGRDVASGNVIRRGILHLKIQDYNRNVIIIPNAIMESCIVVNSDYKNGVNYINNIKVSFDSDLEKAKAIIINAIMSHEKTENKKENTNIIFKNAENGILIEYNVRTPDTNTSFDVCSEIVERVALEIQNEPAVQMV
ncbi:MAG: mechanosensitive ion channel [Firmicutes bacterium]|nr:mechanosensitive ion channel [Bacillota bacterium]